jgi:hypothetical protein
MALSGALPTPRLERGRLPRQLPPQRRPLRLLEGTAPLARSYASSGRSSRLHLPVGPMRRRKKPRPSREVWLSARALSWARIVSVWCATALATTVALSGCGFGYGFKTETVATKPKRSTLRAIHRARFPVYWLGRSANGERLGSVAKSSGSATFYYGPEHRLDGEYRGHPIFISTYAHRKVGPGTKYTWASPRPGGEICTDNVGLALEVWECGSDYFHVVFTGNSEIGIEYEDGSAGELAKEMSLLGAPAAHSGQLPPPTPFSCKEAALIRPEPVREALLREVPSEPCPGGQPPRRPSKFKGALRGLKPLLAR